MIDSDGLGKFVPGFDFLQTLVKNAGAAMPSIGQWVAPTLDPEELEKRIEELRTVQFWLEQNARMIGTTIQALEVQRLTLTTLKTMNVQMDDLRESLKIRIPGVNAPEEPAAAPPAPTPAPARSRAASAVAPAEETGRASADAGGASDDASPTGDDSSAGQDGATAAPPVGQLPAGAVDPMQWWGALTRQFTEIAAKAMQEGASDAARNFAGAMATRAPSSPSPTPAPATRASRGATAPAPVARKGARSPAASGKAAARPPRKSAAKPR